MFKVAEKKARIDRLNGKVDYDRILCVTVTANESWARRSYKDHYSSLPSIVMIVNILEFEKILFFFFHWVSCVLVVPCDHKCFKNLYGLTTQMKSDAIVESFRYNIEMLDIK